ncbi:AAA family ATPase [Paenibacillus sp. NPDC058071]|uniref:AAA family ATPase n=1 Tax=Paenibacillus sp. NPDC058071 TaxID=3346326 RepID=UPI0036D85268
MIIWINGAFGSGKTTTAYELQRRISGSTVYDPEKIGFFLMKNIPPSIAKDDFQHYSIWREMNYTALKYWYEEFNGTIIVPMTIVDPIYFDEIIGKLRRDGVAIHHFALCASKEVLLKRLRSRGQGRTSWAALQIERCVESLSSEIFTSHLDTDKLTTQEVVELIGAQLDIPLLPDNRSNLRRRWDRLITKIKHIR